MKRFQTLFYILLGLTMASALAVVIAWQILGGKPVEESPSFCQRHSDVNPENGGVQGEVS